MGEVHCNNLATGIHWVCICFWRISRVTVPETTERPIALKLGTNMFAPASASPDPLRETRVRNVKISDFIDKVEQFTGRRRFIAVLTFPADRDTVQRLLARSSVAGIILTDAADKNKLDDDRRVGYRERTDPSFWRFPKARASVVAVLGARDAVGLRIARDSFIHGVRSFVFVDPFDGAARTRSIYRVTFPLALRSARGSISRAGRWLISGALALASSLAGLLLRSWIGEMLYARRLRRFLQLAKAIPTDVIPRSDTVILAIASLSPGGSERQIVNTAMMLKREGRFRPLVVCARLQDATSMFYGDLLERAGVEVVNLQVVNTSDAGGPMIELCKSEAAFLGYDIPDDLLRWLIFILNERPKIVHAFLDENNIKVGLAAVLARVPRIVLSARSVAPDNFLLLRGYMRPGYQVLLREHEVIFCNNSSAGARDYRRWLRNRSLKIAVLRNGVDFSSFAPRDRVDLTVRQRFGIPTQALVLGSVMRLSEEKQPELWARVVLEISRRRADVCFVLIGNGPLRPRVEQLIANAGIASRVYDLGQTTEVSTVLRGLDMLLLTSRREGLPNVLIEAQAVGVPVVTTPAGGASETLDPGVTGLIAPDHSVRTVANTCIALLEDHAMRTRMGHAAAPFVRKNFSLERMIEETKRHYEA
jgi:glycosyltransferase involved in cell wall biosynthesis